MTDAVQALIDWPRETVPASMLAPIVGMSPSVIRHKARTGEWDQCAYVLSGPNVKFYKRDFLRHLGIQQEEEAKEDVMADILTELRGIRQALERVQK